MILAIHQPNYLPWLGFFDKLKQADLMVILDEVQFPRRDYCNRTMIKTAQGVQWLTVPVKARAATPIKDVELAESRTNLAKHWQIIVHNYGKCPYFPQYAAEMAGYFHRYHHRLAELNLALLKLVAGWLGIGTPIILESSLGRSMGKGSTRNVNICRYLGADIYLSGQGARAYNDEAAFASVGIELRYQEFRHPVYPQRYGEFIPGLSVIDYFFNTGGDGHGV
ncbi:MAG: WbqC family protein [Clostridia bacterium]|nr:WbqC family protein [Clostridia bacterium]